MMHSNGHSNGSPVLACEQFEEFRSIIYRHSGIHFDENKRYLLESRLLQRMNALRAPTFEKYRKHLSSTDGASELHALTNAVTINETFFFRHPAHLDLLEHQIIPKLVQRRTESAYPRIRIWSAACSSGDEPYSIALMIRDRLQPRFPRVLFEVVASDINGAILASAQRATYAPYAVRNVPPALLERYFSRDGDRYILDPTVRDLVRFRQLNLNDDAAMRSMRGFDVVFCANVLIYFDAEAKRRALANLHSTLQSDGYLFIGFSETLFGVSDAFVAERFDKALVYRRSDRPDSAVTHGMTATLSLSNEASPLQQ